MSYDYVPLPLTGLPAANSVDLMSGMPSLTPENMAPQSFLDSMKSWIPSGFLGSTSPQGIQTPGWGGLAINAGSGLMNAYLGMKQYGIAKDTLAQNKKQFELNFNNQKKMVNTQLEDRQRARVASNPGAYQSVSSYMKDKGL